MKTDKEAAAKTIFTALKAIDSLKILFAPVLPFTSQRLHEFFGYETPLFGEQYTETVKDSLGEHTVLRYRPISALSGGGAWKPSGLKPGQKLNQPGPLFKKLDESIIEEERARLGKYPDDYEVPRTDRNLEAGGVDEVQTRLGDRI